MEELSLAGLVACLMKFERLRKVVGSPGLLSPDALERIRAKLRIPVGDNLGDYVVAVEGMIGLYGYLLDEAVAESPGTHNRDSSLQVLSRELRIEWEPQSGDHFWLGLCVDGWSITFKTTLSADPNLATDGRVLAFYWLTGTPVPLDSELREVNIQRHTVAYLWVFGEMTAEEISMAASTAGMVVDAECVLGLIVANEFPDPAGWLAQVRNKMAKA
jgi:hypothetical protein